MHARGGAAGWAARVAALLALAPSTALAEGLYPKGWAPLPGSVQADIAEKAARQTATFYGTVASLERNVFPRLDAGANFTFTLEQNYLFDVTRVPVVTTDPLAQDRFVSASMSTYATSLVLGGRLSRYFSLFYGTSISTSFFAGSVNEWKVAAAPLFPLVLIYQAPTAPLSVGRFKVLPTIGSKSFGISADYVLGGRLDVANTSLYLGYVGATAGDALYTNITEEKLRLLLSAALGVSGIDNLLYLKAGFDRVRGLLQGKLFEEPKPEEDRGVSKTSLYGRRLQFLPPQPSVPEDNVTDLRRLNFWTGHLEQQNIYGFFDASFALSIKPVFVHEARVSAHTPGFNETTKEGGLGGIRLQAGLVRLPRMAYFAQDGGAKFMLALEVKASSATTSVYISVRRNDPEILSVFPYAYDAWNLYLKMGI